MQSSQELIISELLKSKSENVEILGNPILVQSPFGDAVQFNGMNDALLLNYNPVSGLSEFTIEVLFCPESGGKPEQRFLHFGDVQEDRVLLETRLPDDSTWYFDAFILSGDTRKVLIDSTLLHSLNKWHHIAYIIGNGKFETFIDGKKELEDDAQIPSFKAGKTSIGVRQNLVYWFKGAIYKIKITSKAIKPAEFMKY